MNEHVNVLEIELPEILERNPYAPPRSHLVKAGADDLEETVGRRESRTLLVPRIREKVDTWRERATILFAVRRDIARAAIFRGHRRRLLLNWHRK